MSCIGNRYFNKHVVGKVIRVGIIHRGRGVPQEQIL
jgi:hypothetical protein